MPLSSDVEGSHQCSICLEEGCNVTLACGHHFHIDCIEKWRQPTCPICRHFLSSTSLRLCRMKHDRIERLRTCSAVIVCVHCLLFGWCPSVQSLQLVIVSICASGPTSRAVLLSCCATTNVVFMVMFLNNFTALIYAAALITNILHFVQLLNLSSLLLIDQLASSARDEEQIVTFVTRSLMVE